MAASPTVRSDRPILAGSDIAAAAPQRL